MKLSRRIFLLDLCAGLSGVLAACAYPLGNPLSTSENDLPEGLTPAPSPASTSQQAMSILPAGLALKSVVDVQQVARLVGEGVNDTQGKWKVAARTWA
jgi:hypothetical protein